MATITMRDNTIIRVCAVRINRKYYKNVTRRFREINNYNDSVSFHGPNRHY